MKKSRNALTATTAGKGPTCYIILGCLIQIGFEVLGYDVGLAPLVGIDLEPANLWITVLI